MINIFKTPRKKNKKVDIKYHEYQIAKLEDDLDFHKEKLKELNNEE